MPSLSQYWKIACLLTVFAVTGCSASRSYVSLPLANLRGDLPVERRAESSAVFKGETAAQHFARETILPNTVSALGSSVQDDIVPVGHSTSMSDDSITPAVESVELKTDSASWTLAAIESIALQQNPAVLQASASASKALGCHIQLCLKPNPTIGYQASQLGDR